MRLCRLGSSVKLRLRIHGKRRKCYLEINQRSNFGWKFEGKISILGKNIEQGFKFLTLPMCSYKYETVSVRETGMDCFTYMVYSWTVL